MSSAPDPKSRYTIAPAEASDIEDVRTLFLEYQHSLGFSLCFQNFQQEVESLPGSYSPPRGSLLMARNAEGQAVGVVALRPTEVRDECEMKRLYVGPEARGLGVGFALVHAILGKAVELGYSSIRLDTVPGKMDTAITMYRRLGFVEVQPAYDAPVPLLFLRKQL